MFKAKSIIIGLLFFTTICFAKVAPDKNVYPLKYGRQLTLKSIDGVVTKKQCFQGGMSCFRGSIGEGKTSLSFFVTALSYLKVTAKDLKKIKKNSCDKFLDKSLVANTQLACEKKAGSVSTQLFLKNNILMAITTSQSYDKKHLVKFNQWLKGVAFK